MELNTLQTFNLAILVLFSGKFLNEKINFLREFNIPEPVTGGLLFSLGFTIFYMVTGKSVEFSMHTRDVLLVYFFTGIGLNSKLRTLVQGGKPLFILLLATIGYMFVQNMTGLTVAKAFGLPNAMGVVGGTASLIGGHGTTIAWAPTFASEYGISNAMEVGIACATFGLVLASLMGGPIARYLINKHKLKPKVVEQPDFGVTHDQEDTKIDYLSVLRAWLALNLSIGLGLAINEFLLGIDMQLPVFVCCLLAGIILTNTVPVMFKKMRWPNNSVSLGLISDLSLGIFLAMSLMSLQLWTLIDLAGPILTILLAQFLMAAAFTLFVIFNIMGRDYEAAVVCSGFGGISLGATPTAIANMTAVTKKFGAAHKAFIIVPLVCAFFIDIANAFIIKFFLAL